MNIVRLPYNYLVLFLIKSFIDVFSFLWSSAAVDPLLPRILHSIEAVTAVNIRNEDWSCSCNIDRVRFCQRLCRNHVYSLSVTRCFQSTLLTSILSYLLTTSRKVCKLKFAILVVIKYRRILTRHPKNYNYAIWCTCTCIGGFSMPTFSKWFSCKHSFIFLTYFLKQHCQKLTCSVWQVNHCYK